MEGKYSTQIELTIHITIKPTLIKVVCHSFN